MFSFLTQEIFDGLIILVIFIGGIWAAIRFYQDMTRPLAPEDTDWMEAIPSPYDDFSEFEDDRE